MERIIKIFSTRSNKEIEIKTSATTWGQLKIDAQNQKHVDFSGLKAMENVNRTTLENPEASLPEGEFTVFLAPQKTKSGQIRNFSGFSFKELRQVVKENKEEDGFMDHLNSTGKNYTQLSSDELRNLLESFDFNDEYDEEYEEEEYEEEDDDEEVDLVSSIEKDFNSSCESLRNSLLWVDLGDGRDSIYESMNEIKNNFKKLLDYVEGNSSEIESNSKRIADLRNEADKLFGNI